jgi:hypothetical protein
MFVKVMRRIVIRLTFISALITLVSACQFPLVEEADQQIVYRFVIDPRFQNFYEQLGGVDILGPPISGMQVVDGIWYQYTKSALLTHNPNAPESRQFLLASLGSEYWLTEGPIGKERPKIYRGFVPLYRELGGAKVVGLPLTEVYFNPENNRVEQHFENLGFYYLEGDPARAVKLLDYGAWMCAEYCGVIISDGTIRSSPQVETRIAHAIQQLGLDINFTGDPLTEPYIASDNQWEQIFENMVIYENPESPANISLRPILQMLGIPSWSLETESEIPGMFFYSIEGNLGFNIPDFFRDYLKGNLGFQLSGYPVSGFVRFTEGVYRQCFENLCLDYYHGMDPELRIRPAPIGRAYKNSFYPPEKAEASHRTNTYDKVAIYVWEMQAVIQPTQSQVIRLFIVDDRIPLKNIEPILKLTLPNGDEKIIRFPPTDEKGLTALVLDPIQAKNGTSIEFLVCIEDLSVEPICRSPDGFTIWGGD